MLGDRHQPSIKCSLAARLESTDVTKHLDECLLQDILFGHDAAKSLGQLANNAPGQAVVVVQEQSLGSGLVPGDGVGNQIGLSIVKRHRVRSSEARVNNSVHGGHEAHHTAKTPWIQGSGGIHHTDNHCTQKKADSSDARGLVFAQEAIG